MSFNSNWRMLDLVAPSARRRQLLVAAALTPFALHGPRAAADPLQGLQAWGEGEYRFFGLPVYGARLWAGTDPLQPPLALQLTYRRALKGAAIAEASLREMRHLGGDERQLADWGQRMAGLFPDVRAGDRILGSYRPGGAVFFLNGAWLGEIADPAFARQFFAIWLDERTRAPGLRAALLRRAAVG